MRFLLCFVLCLYFAIADAQEKAEIAFTDTLHYFGIFSEDDGEQICDFVFENTGKIPLFIHEIKTSCGCTVPAYSREPVLPGKQGKITITYHPKGRPGKFDKSIWVKSNASLSGLTLKISGEVTPGKDRYPGYRFRIGNLRLKNTSARLDAVYVGKRVEGRIAVVNEGDEPLTIQSDNLPAGFSVLLEPETLKPRQEGDVVIVCQPVAGSPVGVQTNEILLGVVSSALTVSSAIHITIDILGERE